MIHINHSIGSRLMPTRINPLFSSQKPQPLQETVLTVLDMEMTGIDSIDNNDIIQIAAKKFKNGQQIGRYVTFVKPSRPISEFIQKLTGITNAKVSDAPAVKEALLGLCEFVGENPVLVGHYVGLDIGFIRRKLDGLDLTPGKRAELKERFDLDKAVCTWTLAQKIMPNEPTYRVDSFGPRLGIIKTTHHDAESDVDTAFEMLNKLLNIQRVKNGSEDSLTDMRDIMTLQGPPVARDWIIS